MLCAPKSVALPTASCRMTYKSAVASAAPVICAPMYMRPGSAFIFSVRIMASVTAGLRWPPEMCAVAYTIAAIAIPAANAITT